MEYFSRLTFFEERVWEIIEGALALGESISHQVSRATGDAAVGACEAFFSPLCESAPLLQSSPLSSCQDVEALASSALPEEQHTCEVTSDESQGPEQIHDASSYVVPAPGRDRFCGAIEGALPADGGKDFEGKEGAGSGGSLEIVSAEPSEGACHSEELGGACSFLASASSAVFLYPPFSSSHEASAPCDAQPQEEQSLDAETREGQGAEQTHDIPDDLPAAVRDELASSEQLDQSEPQSCERSPAADGAILACEEGAAVEGNEGPKATRGCEFADLDALCLTRIMSRLDDASLRTCSLVCREWLETSNSARKSLSLQTGPQVAALPQVLARFSGVRTVLVGEEKALPIAEPAFDDASIRAITRGCPGLGSLTLINCDAFSDVGLALLLSGCPNLTTLRLELCNNVSGQCFEEALPCRIEQLILNQCRGWTGLAFAAGACPALRKLDVRVAEGGRELPNSIGSVAKFCTRLEELNVHSCGITDATLRCFAYGRRSLTRVFIGCEPDVTDAGVAALQRGLPLLNSLTLFNCRQLKKIPCIGKNGRLKTLGIGVWLDAPDLVLRQLYKRAGLEDLRIVSCPTLTDVSVGKIFKGCRRLKLLVLRNCELLTSEIFRAYEQSGSQARVVIEFCENIQESALSADMRLSGRIFIREVGHGHTRT